MLLVSRGNEKTSSSDYSKLSATATYLNLLSKLCFTVFGAKIKKHKSGGAEQQMGEGVSDGIKIP